MNTNLKMNRLIIILSIVILLTISVGCALQGKNNTQQDEGNNAGNEQPYPEGTDEELTQELLKEKAVSGGRIYFQNDIAAGAIFIKNDATEQEGREIAQKYADVIREKYEGKKVNVQALHKGENIANIEYGFE